MTSLGRISLYTLSEIRAFHGRFCMLFACGVGTGVFFYGVAEPVYHYIGPNRFSQDHSLPDNQLAQNAILLTFYHWGLHAWAIYTIVGLLLGIMAHRYLFTVGGWVRTLNRKV